MNAVGCLATLGNVPILAVLRGKAGINGMKKMMIIPTQTLATMKSGHTWQENVTMKLSEADRENIEVLEALDIDENVLFLLLCRYFAYRGKRSTGRLGLSPDEALQETIRWRMSNSDEDTARRRSQGAKDGWEIRRAKQTKNEAR